jgi:hypothetical protein
MTAATISSVRAFCLLTYKLIQEWKPFGGFTAELQCTNTRLIHYAFQRGQDGRMDVSLHVHDPRAAPHGRSGTYGSRLPSASRLTAVRLLRLCGRRRLISCKQRLCQLPHISKVPPPNTHSVHRRILYLAAVIPLWLPHAAPATSQHTHVVHHASSESEGGNRGGWQSGQREHGGTTLSSVTLYLHAHCCENLTSRVRNHTEQRHIVSSWSLLWKPHIQSEEPHWAASHCIFMVTAVKTLHPKFKHKFHVCWHPHVSRLQYYRN